MIFINEEKVRTNDMDNFDHLSIKAILNFFQDGAGQHAEKLGIGYQALKDKNLYWVLVKTRITKYLEPKAFSKIYIKTWPLEKGRIDFIRNYEIKDADDNLLVVGSSQWCLIDADSRKIVKTDGISYPGVCFDEKIYHEKLSSIKPLLNNKVFSFRVGNSSLDHNWHMNNSKYADIVYDALMPSEIEKIKDFQINYLHEAKEGDIIDVYKEIVGDEIIISGSILGTPCFSSKVIL